MVLDVADSAARARVGRQTPKCYPLAMTVQLSPQQQRWLEAQVAAGRFDSLEQAIEIAVADLMAMSEDELDWAKPLIDAGLAELGSRKIVAGEDALARIGAIVDKSR